MFYTLTLEGCHKNPIRKPKLNLQQKCQYRVRCERELYWTAAVKKPPLATCWDEWGVTESTTSVIVGTLSVTNRGQTVNILAGCVPGIITQFHRAMSILVRAESWEARVHISLYLVWGIHVSAATARYEYSSRCSGAGRGRGGGSTSLTLTSSWYWATSPGQPRHPRGESWGF